MRKGDAARGGGVRVFCSFTRNDAEGRTAARCVAGAAFSRTLTGFYADAACWAHANNGCGLGDPEFGAQQQVVAPGIGHESQSNWRLTAFNDAGDAIQRIELEIIEPLIWRRIALGGSCPLHGAGNRICATVFEATSGG